MPGRPSGRCEPAVRFLDHFPEITHQLRLRDLGGIIIVDFIDMEVEQNRRAVMDALRAGVRTDRARTRIHPMSDLGLVEMTRQRVREPLVNYFSEGCPTCGGTGKIRSLQAASMRIERSLQRVGAHSKEREVQLTLHPQLAAYLFDERSHRLPDKPAELPEQVLVRPVSP